LIDNLTDCLNLPTDMPDIPLDTLLIIGLVIASFIGKLTQKKASIPQPGNKNTDSSQEDPVRDSASLEDVLKEAWENFNDSSGEPKNEPIAETSAPIPRKKEILKKKVFETKEPQPSYRIKKEPIFSYDHDSSATGTFSTVTGDLKNSNKSLRKAFLLKEILDQPVSIKKTSF
jgi:hypothetical protein